MACVCPTGYTGAACETGERALGQRWGEAGWGDAGGWVGRVPVGQGAGWSEAGVEPSAHLCHPQTWMSAALTPA